MKKAGGKFTGYESRFLLLHSQIRNLVAHCLARLTRQRSTQLDIHSGTHIRDPKQTIQTSNSNDSPMENLDVTIDAVLAV